MELESWVLSALSPPSSSYQELGGGFDTPSEPSEVPPISRSRAGTMASWKELTTMELGEGTGLADSQPQLHFPHALVLPLVAPFISSFYALLPVQPNSSHSDPISLACNVWALVIASCLPTPITLALQYLADIALQPILTRHTTRSGAARGERDGATETKHVNPPLHCVSPGSPRCSPVNTQPRPCRNRLVCPMVDNIRQRGPKTALSAKRLLLGGHCDHCDQGQADRPRAKPMQDGWVGDIANEAPEV